MQLRSLLVALAIAVLAATGSASQQSTPATPRIEEVVNRASAYVADFITRFSNVVAEEHYLQDANVRGQNGGTNRVYRQLKSDFLLVKPTDANTVVAFRDVYEVEGKPVRDRDERLARLFINTTGTELQRAAAIATESAAYNLGAVMRENNPLLVVGFLQPVYRGRFEFTLGRRDADAGMDVWIVNYLEKTRPSLLSSRQFLNEGARGRIWIHAPTGRPVRTELITRRVTMNTRFAFDERLQTDVPVEMIEAYRTPENTLLARGTATYSNFRRFAVTTEETVR